MEPSTTQENDASTLSGLSSSTNADLIGGSDALASFEDPLAAVTTDSSIISSTIESSLFTDKSDISPSHTKPQLEKEIDLDSSKDSGKSDPGSIEAVKDFLNEAKSKPEEITEPVKEIKPEAESFGFNKPLPPEPSDSTSDFLKSEASNGIRNTQEKDEDGSEFVGAASDSPVAISREDSPIPPPIPKHQNLRDESPDRFESSPEPDFKPMEPSKDDEEIFVPKKNMTPPKPAEIKEAPKKEEKTPSVGDIGAKDIIVEIGEFYIYIIACFINGLVLRFGVYCCFIGVVAIVNSLQFKNIYICLEYKNKNYYNFIFQNISKKVILSGLLFFFI